MVRLRRVTSLGEQRRERRSVGRGRWLRVPVSYTQELDDAETQHDNVYDQHDRSDRRGD